MRRLIVIEYKYVKVSSVCIKWFSKLRSKLSFNFHTSTIAPNNWGTDPKCKFVFIRKYYSTVEEGQAPLWLFEDNSQCERLLASITRCRLLNYEK